MHKVGLFHSDSQNENIGTNQIALAPDFCKALVSNVGTVLLFGRNQPHDTRHKHVANAGHWYREPLEQ